MARNQTTFTPGDPRAAAGGRKGGAVKSEARAEKARINGRLGGPKARNPADRLCTCGRGDAVPPEKHKATCRRYRAWHNQTNPKPQSKPKRDEGI